MERPASCIHRWVLGEPRYGVVRGVCRQCGARRRYPSHLEFVEAPKDEELDADRPPLTTVQATMDEHARV